MTHFKTPHPALLAAVAAALVAACGGGGDGPAPVAVPTGARSVAATAGADLSTQNFQTLSAPLVRAVLAASDSALGGFIQGTGRERAQSVRVASAGGAWLPATLKHFTRVAMAGPARERTAASGSAAVPCVSGSATVTVIDATNNNELDGGDSISVSASSCVIESGLPAVSGNFTMAINQVDTDSAGNLSGLDVSVTFSSFGVAGYGFMTGAGRMWAVSTATSATSRISYSNTQVTRGQETVTYNFDSYLVDNGGTVSYELSGGLGINGQTYSVLRGDVLLGSPPGSGSLRLTDVQGDSVRLVARSTTTFDLEFYVAGNPTPVLVIPGLTWSSFDS
jgi:hypothetical protein